MRIPLSELLKNLFTRPSVVHARSTALNSLLWALAILLPCVLLSALLVGGDAFVTRAVTVMAGMALAAVFAAYFYFMLKDPDRLQSEKFMIEQRKLTSIEMKGLESIAIENDGQAVKPAIELESVPEKQIEVGKG